ncbi:MAG: hypothetical protein PVI90_01160 [Desulfobacteraceae bacterium]|jgi:hypothetical protein
MRLADLEADLLRTVTYTSSRTRIQKPIDIVESSTAKQLLQNESTTATCCFKAVELLCGPMFRTWEPETIWLTLAHHSVDVPVINRDKILSAITLTIIPAFWFEINAFENTVLAFNNVLSDGRIVQEATPAQINWAVFEAEMLYNQESAIKESTEFDYEPIQYTAAVLHRKGFVLAPELLSFAQEPLDKMNNGVSVDKNELQTAWNTIKKKDLTKITFEETALDIQLTHLTAVQLYLQKQLHQYQKDMLQLGF